MHRVKLHGLRHVVAVGGHTDDISLHCSGTLARLKAMGCKVTLVVMTTSPSIDHYGRRLTSSEVNHRELERVAGLIATNKPVVLGYKNNHVPYDEDSVHRLNKIFDETSADLIFTHYPFDNQYDHQNTSKAVISAARRYPNILMFEEHIGRPSLAPSLRHVVYFDISDTLHIKLKAIRCHKSEYQRLGGEKFSKMWEWRARLRGAEIGTKAAEAFQPAKMVLNTFLVLTQR